MCMRVLRACTPVYHVRLDAWGCRKRLQMAMSHWKLNQGPLGEQPLVVTAEPSLQFHEIYDLMIHGKGRSKILLEL